MTRPIQTCVNCKNAKLYFSVTEEQGTNPMVSLSLKIDMSKWCDCVEAE